MSLLLLFGHKRRKLVPICQGNYETGELPPKQHSRRNQRTPAMTPLSLLFCGAVVWGLFLLIRTTGHIDPPPRAPSALAAEDRIDAAVERVDASLHEQWTAEAIQPAGHCDDLALFRRLSLALHGTIPSLEEVRSFASDTSSDRIDRWLLKMLDDQRFADYFGERLTRMLVGNDEGAFVVFRRDRLADWMTQQLRHDRPWSEIVHRLIAGDGLWTQEGNTNFITAAFVDDEGLDENKLAGKTVRAFLGQRIDCAQCHDHFFADWKQTDFEGLAAFYGQARITPGGVIDRKQEDGQPIVYEVVEPGTDEGRLVEPKVPFHSEWQIKKGTRRRQLASWVVHPENRRFRRAAANRIWGLMFGRAWSEPVDDLPDPGDEHDLLDILAEEFANHDDSLKFLIRMIAQSEAFRLRSDDPEVSEEAYNEMEQHWAIFPLVRLRPEQVIGSMVQAGNILTIDQNSHVFTRFARFNSENDFLKQYGEMPEDELLQQSGTIPQALLRMNGKFTRDLTKVKLLSSVGLILSYSNTDESIIDNCFLACLTRLPTDEERTTFGNELTGIAADEGNHKKTRQRAIEDLFWTLFNAPEFSWNH